MKHVRFLSLFGLAAIIGTPVLSQGSSSTQPGPSTQSGPSMSSLPDKTWGVQVDLTGFRVTRSELQPDGRRYMLADNPKTGVIFSVYLEETVPGEKPHSCEETLRARVQQQGLAMGDWRMRTDGERTVLDYKIDRIVPVTQGNRVVCQFYDNVFIDIHFSKMDFKKDDSKLFDALTDSVSIHQGVARSSLDYTKMGSIYYLHNDYKRAIPPYEQALALEKQNPQLEKKMWYVLVDNLGMAYGISGDLEKARATFEYGIQTDPNYPLFYYNMACYFGERHEADNALQYLQKAFDRKANGIPGEGIPDPLSDASFKSLLKDKAFREKLNAIIKGT